MFDLMSSGLVSLMFDLVTYTPPHLFTQIWFATVGRAPSRRPSTRRTGAAATWTKAARAAGPVPRPAGRARASQSSAPWRLARSVSVRFPSLVVSAVCLVGGCHDISGLGAGGLGDRSLRPPVVVNFWLILITIPSPLILWSRTGNYECLYAILALISRESILGLILGVDVASVDLSVFGGLVVGVIILT